VQVPWNFTSNNLSRNARVIVQACGVEMVYVAQGPFYLGDGATANGFYKYPNLNNPYQVTNENAIAMSAATGNLYYDWSYSGDKPPNTTIPAAYPKGYNAFYCMKYEITQGQYRDFLNALTRDQQAGRSRSLVADRFCMSDIASISYRNSIRCPSVIPAAPEPVVFGCDFDGDKTLNESNDGMDLACNFLQSADVFAFAAWAGLRPMSELEYEKACRGPLDPTGNEYAWGSAEISATTSMGATDGTGTNLATGGNCNYSACTPDGPYRVGIYATATSSRQAAGGSYWGIMDLTGNVKEWMVAVASTAGRLFTGLHGNGALTAAGAFDAALNWNSISSGRGGGWADGPPGYLRVCERTMTYYAPQDSYRGQGGRAVRTAPVEVTP
jgi:formylglycine-generating enzyme required for sulfatase activity